MNLLSVHESLLVKGTESATLVNLRSVGMMDVVLTEADFARHELTVALAGRKTFLSFFILFNDI